MQALEPGTLVRCEYRGTHVGTVLAIDDPLAWNDSIAFAPDGPPSREAVTDHVAWCRSQGLTFSTPVLWAFGEVYWDTKLTRFENSCASCGADVRLGDYCRLCLGWDYENEGGR